jgi:hypothetical protein
MTHGLVGQEEDEVAADVSSVSSSGRSAGHWSAAASVADTAGATAATFRKRRRLVM